MYIPPAFRVEDVSKLGQNRSAEDTQGVFNALYHSADADSLALARMMLTECNVNENAQPPTAHRKANTPFTFQRAEQK